MSFKVHAFEYIVAVVDDVKSPEEAVMAFRKSHPTADIQGVEQTEEYVAYVGSCSVCGCPVLLNQEHQITEEGILHGACIKHHYVI